MKHIDLSRVSAAAIALAIAAAGSSGLGAQQAPTTDIWLVPLDLGAGTLGEPRNVTDRDGYDNQPFFAPEGRSLLYTAQHDGQTDIYRLDLSTLVAAQLTDTPESEYSATVVPGGFEFSVIRVEEDGTQRLWSFRRDGSSPQLVLENVAPVGYQAWNSDDELVMFVLGEPATLQLADRDADAAEVVASDIGRSLHAIPDESGRFSFLHRVDGAWSIRSFDPESGEIGDLGAPFEDSQDMAWTPDGRIVMGSGSRLATRAPDGDWNVLGDLAEAGVSGITRVAVHPEGNWLAVVAAR
jgi:Tol biopolymer transport system component